MRLALRQPYKQFFGTLANQVRLDIIEVLAAGPANVSRIVERVRYGQSSVSHSLARLRECGFVSVEQTGRERVYHLNQDTIAPLLSLMKEHMENHCRHVVGCKK